MKRLLIIFGSILTVLVVSAILLHSRIGKGVKENIEIAQKKYSGSPEEALISFLQDENNTPYDQTHVAVWTLGQLDSENALPILKELYKNDPEGETCYGKHEGVLCQYELYKSIKSIETARPFTYAKLKSK